MEKKQEGNQDIAQMLTVAIQCLSGQPVSSIAIRNDFLSIAVGQEKLQKELAKYIASESSGSSQSNGDEKQPVTQSSSPSPSPSPSPSLSPSSFSSSCSNQSDDLKSGQEAPRLHDIEVLFNLIYFCAKRECESATQDTDRKQADSQETNANIESKAREIISQYAGNAALQVSLQEKYDAYIGQGKQTDLTNSFDAIGGLFPFIDLIAETAQVVDAFHGFIEDFDQDSYSQILGRLFPNDASLGARSQLGADSAIKLFNFYLSTKNYSDDVLRGIYYKTLAVSEFISIEKHGKQAHYFLSNISVAVKYLCGNKGIPLNPNMHEIIKADSQCRNFMAEFLLFNFTRTPADQADSQNLLALEDKALDNPELDSLKSNVEKYLMAVARFNDRHLRERYFEKLKQLIKEENHKKIRADIIRLYIANGNKGLLDKLELLSDDFVFYLGEPSVQEKPVFRELDQDFPKNIFCIMNSFSNIQRINHNSLPDNIDNHAKILFSDVFFRLAKLRLRDGFEENLKKPIEKLAPLMREIFIRLNLENKTRKSFISKFNRLMDIIIANPLSSTLYLDTLSECLNTKLPSLGYYNLMLERMREIAERQFLVSEVSCSNDSEQEHNGASSAAQLSHLPVPAQSAQRPAEAKKAKKAKEELNTLSKNVKTIKRLTERNCLGKRKQAFETGAKCVASAIISAGAATYGGLLLAHAAPLIPWVASAAVVSMLPWILLVGGACLVAGAVICCVKEASRRCKELNQAKVGLRTPAVARQSAR